MKKYVIDEAAFVAEFERKATFWRRVRVCVREAFLVALFIYGQKFCHSLDGFGQEFQIMMLVIVTAFSLAAMYAARRFSGEQW